MNELIQEVRNYFKTHYLHVHLELLGDSIITCFLEEPYVANIEGDDAFERKMDLLYDYILSQNLTEIDE
jgi:hypothetical protein